MLIYFLNDGDNSNTLASIIV